MIPDDDHRNEHGEHGRHGDSRRSIRNTSTRTTAGRWRSTSICASAARRAPRRATSRTTFPSSAPSSTARAARCRGSGSSLSTTTGGKPEFQPMLCQHCEHAPCETVCPVYATYHNPEGLNAQVYNRCVGTRYCANNCPVQGPSFQLVRFPAPDRGESDAEPGGVGARAVASWRNARSASSGYARRARRRRTSKRKIADGEVIPACAQTCPTNAIVFGNIDDANSEVSRWARSERAYRVFEQLGTRPAVYYLKSGWKKDHA